jgi:hypothetical protein
VVEWLLYFCVEQRRLVVLVDRRPLWDWTFDGGRAISGYPDEK